jgi:hypothetical protein
MRSARTTVRVARLVCARHRRPLVQLHAEAQSSPSKSEGERSRIHEGDAGALDDGAEVGGRGDLGPYGVPVEHLGLPAVAPQQCRLLVELGQLVRTRRDRQHPGLEPRRLDAVALQVRLQSFEVVARQRLELIELLREARGAVRQAVRERGVDEPAVAAAGAPAGRLGLEQHHLPRRPLLLGLQRRPQAGEAAAHDRQVGLDGALERRRLGRPWAVEPVGVRRGIVEQHARSMEACRAGWTSSRSPRSSSGRC